MGDALVMRCPLTSSAALMRTNRAKESSLTPNSWPCSIPLSMAEELTPLTRLDVRDMATLISPQTQVCCLRLKSAAERRARRVLSTPTDCRRLSISFALDQSYLSKFTVHIINLSGFIKLANRIFVFIIKYLLYLIWVLSDLKPPHALATCEAREAMLTARSSAAALGCPPHCAAPPARQRRGRCSAALPAEAVVQVFEPRLDAGAAAAQLAVMASTLGVGAYWWCDTALFVRRMHEGCPKFLQIWNRLTSRSR